ncbi:MAG: MFS transporter [Ignavibacteriales bacterium]|nr:MFS transporter [Ignavibacteriales bacterium]
MTTGSPRASDAYAALRYPEFRAYIAASTIHNIALLVQEVVIAYELYRITRDPLALGLTGLAAAIPFISLSLFGGHVADRLSKRTIILWTVVLVTFATAGLCVCVNAAEAHRLSSDALIAMFYLVIFFIGVCRAFRAPAVSALRAFLVPPSLYENATKWSTSSWQVASVVGPSLSGFSYLVVGLSGTLLFVVVLLAISWYFFSRIGDKPVPPEPNESSIISSVMEGVRFAHRTKIIFYSISLDMLSVLFGGVVAILPIYAEDILHVGAGGLGILRAASSAGAIVTVIALARFSVIKHPWRNLLIATSGFGVWILVFAVSPWMMLSVLALFMSGAFDSISVVIRQTILQLMTPDNMRGRVMAVSGIFISSSNELGAFESGFAARLMGTVPSAVFGAVTTLAIVAWVFSKSKELLKVQPTTASH